VIDAIGVAPLYLLCWYHKGPGKELPMIAVISRWLAAFTILWGASVAQSAEHNPRPPEAPKWDAAAFTAMDAPAKLAFVRAALQWRDERLSNFRYELTEVVKDLDVTTRELKRQVGEDRHYEVRKSGEKYLVTAISNVGYAGDIPRRFWSRWDGAVFRTFSEAGNKNKASGIIRAQQHDILFQIEYDQLLGLRVHGVHRLQQGQVYSVELMLAQWVDHFIAQGKEATPQISLEMDDEGVPWIELKVKADKYTTHLFVLDPRRQYLPTRFQHIYSTGRFSHGASQRVTQANQIDGLWVPMTVLVTVRHVSDPSTDQERIYTVSKFTLGDVKDDDLKVDFGPGAQVVDATTHVAYHLDADRKPTAQPLADVKTAKAYTANEQELADALAVNPIQDDIADATVAARKLKIAQYAGRLEARQHADDPVWKKPAPPLPEGGIWHNSKPLTWDSLKGKLVILHFHADWCAPCKNDYPMLVRLHENKSKDLVVVGVHVAGSPPEKVEKLLQEYKLSYPICEDAPPAEGQNGWGETFAAYGVSAVPHAILVDPDGKGVERGTLSDVYGAAIDLMSKNATRNK
jgi:thiol-disulfide isomerase/thioredoxin